IAQARLRVLRVGDPQLLAVAVPQLGVVAQRDRPAMISRAVRLLRVAARFQIAHELLRFALLAHAETGSDILPLARRALSRSVDLVSLLVDRPHVIPSSRARTRTVRESTARR